MTWSFYVSVLWGILLGTTVGLLMLHSTKTKQWSGIAAGVGTVVGYLLAVHAAIAIGLG